MRPHEKLDVWNRAMDFVVAVYDATGGFPKDERFGLTSQVRRASISVPANIAEGAARSTRKEFCYFLSNAQGSASELETQILLAFRLRYIDKETYLALRKELLDIGRMLIGLTNKLKREVPAR